MAKLSKQEIEQIVERDMPGYKVVRHEEGADEPAPQAQPDQAAPAIETLREKYLGDATESAAESSNRGSNEEASAENTDEHSTNQDEDDMEDAIVAVQPTEPSDPFDHAARPKTIVVSGKDRRVIGSQG